MDKELQKNRKKNKKMINKQKHQQYIERKYCYNCNETGKEKQVIKALQRVLIIKLYAGMKRPNFEPLFFALFVRT